MTLRAATISDCGLYRYRLQRRFGDRYSVMFLMVNPSTADADKDDPTIRKCIGFAEKMGAGEILVGNLFAYRATDVRELRKARDPIGPDNDRHLSEMLRESEYVIAAWGASTKLPEALRPRWKDVVRLIDAAGKSIHCIGTCDDGHPRHPLMPAYAELIQPWAVPWFPNRKNAGDGELERGSEK